MMNKRRTKEIGRTKYLMFIPLAALLLIVSNIEMVARTTERFAKEVFAKEGMEKMDTPNMKVSEIADIPEISAKEMQVMKSQIEPATMETTAMKIAKTPTRQENKVAQKEVPMTKIKAIPDSVVFEVVEKMPDFPGGMNGLIEYLKTNVKYPAEAHKAGIQGRVIVSFVVTKDGSISDAKIIRSVDPNLDKEALRVISAMPKWTPGTQRGQAVNVRFSVPVAFRLSNPEPPKAEEIKNLEEVVVVGYGPKEDPAATGIKANESEPIFKVVETMPKFPGGLRGVMQYLAKSIKYPVLAQEHKEEGQVILKMVIGKDGSLSNISVLRSVSPSLDAEAIRVVSNMPKWEPGQQRGQAVAVEYTLPITFRLQ